MVFHLKRPDATFPQKVASGAGSIVDHRVYPADHLRRDHKAIGSGVYTMKSFSKKEAVFEVNSDYKGPARVQNSGMTMKFFHGHQARLKRAVQHGDIDLAYRGLSTDAIASLEKSTAATTRASRSSRAPAPRSSTWSSTSTTRSPGSSACAGPSPI